ncbi:phospholipase A1-II 6 [Selaginella moellendorffii]|nr:phospholipase A1-II 6 [Selaginella moellendorffii]|eukprot:XP_002966078.2 phospholipase A1-II 6 [Selaginella moellendorffii]
MTTFSKLANKWRAVQGEAHWAGLLDPLDEELAVELIRYGQFVDAVYSSFNSNPRSKVLGYSRYGKSQLLDKVHVAPGYKIHKFLYCTTLLESLVGKVVEAVVDFTGPATSWFGFVAVSDDEETRRIGRRDIVIVFRGTQQDIEWASNLLNFFQANMTSKPTSFFDTMSGLPPLDATPEEIATAAATPAQAEQPPARKGFGLLGGIAGGVITAVRDIHSNLPWNKITIGNRWVVPYTSINAADATGLGKLSARQQVMEAVCKLIDLYKDDELSITVTGHSLGAAIATVCAYDIANEKKNRNPLSGATIPVTAFPFASPRVGNLEFRAAVKNVEGLRILRIGNLPDVVTLVPPILWGYVHTDDELSLNTPDSPHLSFPTLALGQFHDLQVYFHLIDYKFDPALKHHQLELVNKFSNALRNPTVPDSWWVVENNDVIRDENGKWVFKSYKVTADEEQFN